MSELTVERLRQLLHYDPATGVFKRLVSLRGGARVGDIAGSKGSHGYLAICIDATLYLSHHLAWLYMTGQFPKNQIDHKNGIKLDNRWDNLREATSAQNNANSKMFVTNTSGFKGVAWHSQTQKWRAQLYVNNRQQYLGLFETKEDAYAAYCHAAKELRGEYARL